MTEQSKKHYDIDESDLPLCCPLPRLALWDQHPRVYIPIRSGDEAVCPYCGTTFTLKEKHAERV
ncbi:MAG: zinc-finger protein [Gammaproteobacteria bacterium]|jgi:uncharacterized Zn-finger protein|nr:zinc-finger protein [Gammaproteobacteria bacterium]